MLSIIVETNIELFITRMHGDYLFHALKEVVSSCPA
jgi:hypothetical protein